MEFIAWVKSQGRPFIVDSQAGEFTGDILYTLRIGRGNTLDTHSWNLWYKHKNASTDAN